MNARQSQHRHGTVCLRAQFMGTVHSVGTGVTHVAVGDRVVACFDIACGRCFHCKKAGHDALQLEGSCAVELMQGGKS